MAKETVLTSEGLKKLEQELEELKTIKRKEVADKIKVAISFGDLSENSEYDEAKNEQAMIESRILQVEAMLKNVKILDAGDLSTEHITVGSKVKVLDMEFEEEETFHIVGSTEANPDEGRISDECPIGKNLLGHGVGDIVAIPVPNGTVTYKILEIMM
ncbi:MAG: transcription elongation factor GreA [Candidatus Merdivicinus sp.]|jgi:transcription elongation factor GreA